MYKPHTDDPDALDIRVTPFADRAKPEVRGRLSGPAMRTFLNIAQAWNLSFEEQRGLLGWPARSTLYNYQNGIRRDPSGDPFSLLAIQLESSIARRASRRRPET